MRVKVATGCVCVLQVRTKLDSAGGIDKYVGRLDVAMHHQIVVQILECLKGLAGDDGDLRLGDRLVAHTAATNEMCHTRETDNTIELHTSHTTHIAHLTLTHTNLLSEAFPRSVVAESVGVT